MQDPVLFTCLTHLNHPSSFELAHYT